jgi:hypothetical protein
VCAYGAFGAVTKERLEVVIEGTRSALPDDDAVWEAYEFKGKPGDPRRRPPHVAPYHLRLDWLMWFLPFSVRIGRAGLLSVMQEWWFLRLVEKLLEGDLPTRRLLSRRSPFADAPPELVRASLYRYELALAERASGDGGVVAARARGALPGADVAKGSCGARGGLSDPGPLFFRLFRSRLVPTGSMHRDPPDIGPVSDGAAAVSSGLGGGGEMAERVRAKDWSATPLGPMASWSPALRSTVDLILANRFPMLLWWGPDSISIYNDAYVPVLGVKHPQVLGVPVRECWSEIWDVLRPLILTPLHGGPSTWSEDLAVDIERYGFPEETHWTVAYSPVPDAAAPRGIGGVLATVARDDRPGGRAATPRALARPRSHQ